MARYMERAENVARIIEVNSHMTLDMPGEEKGQWRPLITITGDEAQFGARYEVANQENVIRFLAFDRENPNSIISCLSAARENARVVRSSITTEMWEQINKMYLFVNQAAISPDVLESPYIFYTRVKMSALLYQGITEATMTHGEAWHFCRLGRSLERADKTSRLLDVKYFILLPTVDYVGLSIDDIQWAAVLRSASAFEMYRRTYGVIQPDQVAEFLLLDRDFPRTVLHCLYRAEESLRWIAGAREGIAQTLPERRLGQLRSDLTYMRIDEIIAGGLHEFLDRFQLRLNMVGTAIYDTFFALHPAS
jgi:uncharacterized alpha-E superfamily protein